MKKFLMVVLMLLSSYSVFAFDMDRPGGVQKGLDFIFRPMGDDLGREKLSPKGKIWVTEFYSAFALYKQHHFEAARLKLSKLYPLIPKSFSDNWDEISYFYAYFYGDCYEGLGQKQLATRWREDAVKGWNHMFEGDIPEGMEYAFEYRAKQRSGIFQRYMNVLDREVFVQDGE